MISADVPRVSDSPIVERAVDQLMLRDPDLADRWQKLHDSCKLDVNRIQHVLLAIGPRGNQNGVGTGPVLMVATGKITEAELTACVRSMVGSGSGMGGRVSSGTSVVVVPTGGASVSGSRPSSSVGRPGAPVERGASTSCSGRPRPRTRPTTAPTPSARMTTVWKRPQRSASSRAGARVTTTVPGAARFTGALCRSRTGGALSR